MKTLNNIPIIGLSLAFFSGCGGDDGSSSSTPTVDEIDPAFNITAVDIANNGNGADIEISFVKPSTTGIAEFRITIVKSSQSGGYDLNTANGVPSGNYFSVDKDVSGVKINLSANTNDTDGESIVNGIGYNVFMLSVAEANLEVENALSEPSASITLEVKSAVRNLTGYFSAGSGGMDADATGNIYMGDFGPDLNGAGQRVYIITPQGDVDIFASGLNGASGNDFDADGNLFQSSITGGFISKITPTGTATTFVSDGIVAPVGIAIDSEGNLFVANCGNNTIQKITKDGVSTPYSTSSLLSCPNGIDVDSEGNLFIANFNNGAVVKIAPDGTTSIFATIPGNNNGHLLLHDDFLYVVARGLHRIYKVNMSGQIEIFAGSGERGNDNGTLEEASFSLPNDIAFSPDGKKMYVNDIDPNAGANNIISPVIIREIDIIE